MKTIFEYSKRWFPPPTTGNWSERVRAGVGACVGILITGLMAAFVATHYGWESVFLIAPMGASAVILFCLPSSPLAQPWSILGGNTLAACCGVFFFQQFSAYPALAAALAMLFATLGMFVGRCLHPPSGAVALTAVLGSPAIHDLGYQYVLWPVLGNSMLLVIAAIAYNNLTGRPYPMTMTTPTPATPEHMHYQFGFKQEDLAAAMQQVHEVIDISPQDLKHLLEKTELMAYQRKMGEISCKHVMSPVATTLTFGDTLEEAWTLLRQQPYPAIPVVNSAQRVIGLLCHDDFMRHAQPASFAHVRPSFTHLIRRSHQTHGNKPEVVGQIMTTPAVTISQDAHIIHMVPLITTHDLHVIPVVDEESRLVGILSQSDVIRALYA